MKIRVFRSFSFITEQDIHDIHGVNQTKPDEQKTQSPWKLRQPLNKAEINKVKHKTKIDCTKNLPCCQPKLNMKDRLEKIKRVVDDREEKYKQEKTKLRHVSDINELKNSLSPIEL